MSAARGPAARRPTSWRTVSVVKSGAPRCQPRSTSPAISGSPTTSTTITPGGGAGVVAATISRMGLGS